MGSQPRQQSRCGNLGKPGPCDRKPGGKGHVIPLSRGGGALRRSHPKLEGRALGVRSPVGAESLPFCERRAQWGALDTQ